MNEIENIPLTEILFDYNVLFPKFLFYFDCSFISSILKSDPNSNIRQCKNFLFFILTLIFSDKTGINFYMNK